MKHKSRDLLELVVELGIAISLMTILLYIGLEMPVGISGGTLNFGMIVIIFMSIRRGILIGMLMGLIMGIEHFFMGSGYFLSPTHPAIGLLLDYYTQYMALSLGVIWLSVFKISKSNHYLTNSFIIMLVITTSFMLALINESLSGMIAWTNGSHGWPLVIFVLITNYPYLLATYIMTSLVLIPLMNIAIKSELPFILPHKYRLISFKSNCNQELIKINIDKASE